MDFEDLHYQTAPGMLRMTVVPADTKKRTKMYIRIVYPFIPS